jgi:ppGpp synthetase/RelA/SpoT-type nucleotidyltranferase
MSGWRVPLRHSISQVNNAGRALSEDSEDHEVINIVNNWRGIHGFPLNAIQMDLKNAAHKVEKNCVLVQRLKRLPSIKNKLKRSRARGSELKLTQIQDIGGCRAVFETEESARLLFNRYLNGSRIGHELWGNNDYVTRPAPTGYRSFHIKLKYKSTKDHLIQYNGLRIEIQIRSKIQHLWATAAEIVGTMRYEPLKWGEGDPIWLRFFQLTSGAMAYLENTAPVPGIPNNFQDILVELKDYEKKLNALDFLINCTTGMQWIEEKKHLKYRHFFVMELDREQKTTKVYKYTTREIRRALAKYNQLELFEEKRKSIDVVLVAADSVVALKRAYPNYHFDTSAFVEVFRRILG